MLLTCRAKRESPQRQRLPAIVLFFQRQRLLAASSDRPQRQRLLVVAACFYLARIRRVTKVKLFQR